MRALLQRVSEASVEVEGEQIARIGRGLLAFVGISAQDTIAQVDVLAQKIVHLRIFEDDVGKMNRSVLDANGELLVVSQFTLYGDCRKGRRPSFSEAMAPEPANALFEQLIDALRRYPLGVQTGRFRADMQVFLCNDGPVTLLLEISPEQ